MAKKPNLAKLSLAELKALQKDIDKAIGKVKADARNAARADAESIAKKHGLSLKELVGGKSKRGTAKRPPVAPKYRHPKDKSLTWSGRGRQPVWFKEAVESGVSVKKLSI